MLVFVLVFGLHFCLVGVMCALCGKVFRLCFLVGIFEFVCGFGAERCVQVQNLTASCIQDIGSSLNHMGVPYYFGASKKGL